MIPRSFRLTRFLITAFPRRFVVIKPNFEGVFVEHLKYPRTRKRPWTDFPFERTN